MATRHDDLREELMAVISAAPELEQGEREHLADVFLDRLEAEYRLVPRGEASPEPPRRSRGVAVGFPVGMMSFWPGIFAFLGVMILLSVLVTSAIHALHLPFLLFAVLIFFIARSRGWGPRRRMHL